MKFVPCLSPEIRSRAVVIFYWFLFALSLIGTRQLAVAQAGTLNKAGAPQAPNTAALGKFVELPVGYHTGVPNISIPLSTLTDGNFSLPVSLDYHASGLKPKEIPGWVGAGWSLSAGGMITRIVRGIPDDRIINPSRDEFAYELKRRFKSALTKGITQEFNSNELSIIINNSPFLKAGIQGGMTPNDYEPDLYFFNFMGRSGRFTFSTEGKIILLPSNDLLIEKTVDKNFKITDERGIQYFFTATEKSNNSVGEGYSSGEDYISGWYLTKIEIPHTNQVMEFRYRKFSNAQLYDPQYYLNNPSLWSHSLKLSILDLSAGNDEGAFYPRDVCFPYEAGVQDLRSDRNATALFLDTVFIGKDTIRFFGNLNRQDLYKYKLDSIQVRHQNNTITRVYLNYGYFNSASTDIWMKKMKLDSLKIDDKSYSFMYYDKYLQYGVPGLQATGEDLWGFYNGEAAEGNGQSTNYKAYSYNNQFSGLSTFRNPDYEFAKLGTLSAIQYPTGGITHFEYEGNDFGEVSFLNSPDLLLTDDATQLVFDSVYSKSTSANTIYPAGPNSATGTTDFIIRNTQTVKITGGIGLLPTAINFATYQGIVGNYHSASYSILKFDENTQTFVGIGGESVIPEELIGQVTTESAWEDIYRFKGWKLVNTNLQLTPGKYRIRCNASGLQMNAGISVAVNFPYKNTNGAFKAGGIRIKKISFDSRFSGLPSYVKKYDYSLDGGSSGVLESPFSNATPFGYSGIEKIIQQENAPPIILQEVCYFINISQTPVIPLGNAQGGIIGYSRVKETLENNASTIYHYTTGAIPGNSDVFHESTIFYGAFTRTAIKKDMSWKRGLLSQVDYYNGNEQLVRQEFSDYSFVTPFKDTAVSLLVDPYYDMAVGPYLIYEVDYAVVTSNLSLKVRDSIVTYSPAGNLYEVKRYDYAPEKYTFPTSIASETSDGRVKVTRFKYPKDYKLGNTPVGAVAGSIKNLLDRNMTSSPIEKYEQIQDRNGANVKTLSAEYIRYNLTRPMPDSVFRMRIAAPITSYQPVVIDSVKEVRNVLLEPRLIFSRYDAFGNVIEQVGRDGIKESLIWGYGNKFLVAHLIGVGYDEAMMGVNTSVINQPATDALLRNEIQFIRNRLAAKKVMVTGYTYSPQIGITSISNPDSKVAYYEYDSYNRLKLIRDQDGKIISQHEYKFQATN